MHLKKRTHLKLGELSSLFIVHNITISWQYQLHGLWFYFLLRDNELTLLLTNYATQPVSNHRKIKSHNLRNCLITFDTQLKTILNNICNLQSAGIMEDFPNNSTSKKHTKANLSEEKKAIWSQYMFLHSLDNDKRPRNCELSEYKLLNFFASTFAQSTRAERVEVPTDKKSVSALFWNQSDWRV